MKKISLVLLGVAALLGSRVVFLFINDPEGPNLLVVVGLAVIIFFVVLAAIKVTNSIFRKTFIIGYLWIVAVKSPGRA
jgi:hypothetical protein